MEQKTYTGKGVGVATLDTGIWSHVDFEDRICAFSDFLAYRQKPYDDNGHGTHVAGILEEAEKLPKENIKGLQGNVISLR